VQRAPDAAHIGPPTVVVRMSIKQSVPTSNEQSIPFEHRNFGSAQLEQIFDCGKTHLWQVVIPALQEEGGVYYEGNRVKAAGLSIIKYRQRKLAEPRASRPMPKNHHEKRKRRSRKSGTAP
jgi:hypothetical protein